jgi:hypothetical protein
MDFIKRVIESCGIGVRPHPDLLLKEKATYAQH